MRDTKFEQVQATEKAGAFGVRVSNLESKIEKLFEVVEQLRKEIEKLKEDANTKTELR